MRILGPAIVTRKQQDAMRRKGHAMLILPRDSVFADAAERAKPGDVWWVKEPHFDVRSPQFGCCTVHEIVPGEGFRRYCVPEHVKPVAHLCRWNQQPTKDMRRGDSLACLEIVETASRPAPGWLCRVILQNVDKQFPKQVAA